MSSCALNRSPLIVAMPMLHCRWNTCSCSTCFTLRMSSSTCAATTLRVLPRDVRQQHDELVAAETRDEILAAHTVADLLRRELQQLVAGRVSARVVDVLELIEVDEEQRAAPFARGAIARSRRLERCDQAMPIVEARQRVVTREMQQVPLALLQRAYRVVRAPRRSPAAPCAWDAETRRPCRRRRASRAAVGAPIAARARASGTAGRPPRTRRAGATACRSRARGAAGKRSRTPRNRDRRSRTRAARSTSSAALGLKLNRPSPASDSLQIGPERR